MHFPNWDTYYFFQQQEIKRALHQSALGLFLRVWEEVSAIFIDYLRNSPASPFGDQGDSILRSPVWTTHQHR